MSGRRVPLLEGLQVVEIGLFLAGPLAALRLADQGADVVKVERPGTGDPTRKLVLGNATVGGDSLEFHLINRGKQSVEIDFHSARDRHVLEQLIANADVIVESFRPGVLERAGFGYERARMINPSVVYGRVSGYGRHGSWAHLPGQDLLAQARSGLMYTNRLAAERPVPVAVSIADFLTGLNLAEAILSGLIRRERTGIGCLADVSLLESLLDLQFESIASHLHTGEATSPLPLESANALIPPPYGVYETADGYLAIAMGSLEVIAEVVGSQELASRASDPSHEASSAIADALLTSSAAEWERLLTEHGVWAAEVLAPHRAMNTEHVRSLEMIHQLKTGSGEAFHVTRNPITIDGEINRPTDSGPDLGHCRSLASWGLEA